MLELSRDGFEALIQDAPDFALALTRSMGAQLAASRTPVAAATPPRTIAVLGLDGDAPVAEVAEGLANALCAYGAVARLISGGLAAIDQAEGDCERVVLCAGSVPGEEWTRICVHETDLVLAVTRGAPERVWLEQAAALRGCELVVLGPAVSGAVISQLQPREVQVLADAARRNPALEAPARRLAGRSLGIVLSGGGARALAHLGALEELSAAGLRFDRVAGVSLGSLVGAAAAMGLEPQEICEMFERNFRATNPTRDFTLPVFSLLRGTKARRLLQDAFGERRIEELALRFFCLSCDLVEREPVIHRTGRVVDAVYPSFAIPGVFPPVARTDACSSTAACSTTCPCPRCAHRRGPGDRRRRHGRDRAHPAAGAARPRARGPAGAPRPDGQRGGVSGARRDAPAHAHGGQRRHGRCCEAARRPPHHPAGRRHRSDGVARGRAHARARQAGGASGARSRLRPSDAARYLGR